MVVSTQVLEGTLSEIERQSSDLPCAPETCAYTLLIVAALYERPTRPLRRDR